MPGGMVHAFQYFSTESYSAFAVSIFPSDIYGSILNPLVKARMQGKKWLNQDLL